MNSIIFKSQFLILVIIGMWGFHCKDVFMQLSFANFRHNGNVTTWI
jgi:hypothetical protein